MFESITTTGTLTYPSAYETSWQNIIVTNQSTSKFPSTWNTYSSKFDFVDLGLSVKWATCNVGASKPEKFGLFFAWGETQGYTEPKPFRWSNYKFSSDANGTTITKYNDTDGLTTLQAEDDAVTALDSSIRIPTQSELNELLNNTTSEWTYVNGVSGVRFTALNGKSIFVPAAGLMEGSGHIYEYESMNLRSSSTSNKNFALTLSCDIDEKPKMVHTQRYAGYPLRAVKP
jgi:hypothetical protein